MSVRPPDPLNATTATESPAGRPGESTAVPRTRAGTAWVLACGAAVALLVLIVFIAQNTHAAQVSFLVWHGDFPLAVALLAAALIGVVLTLILGSTRIIQLRRTARSRRPRPQPPARTTTGAPERSAR